MTNWNQRITKAREDRHMTKAEFARACEVKPPTVTGWESGDIKELTALKMLKICDVLHIDPWWLVLGKGNFKSSITEEKTVLSTEAKKLISWIERVDALGDPARKFFGFIYAALQVAGILTQAQNPPGDAAMAGAEGELTSHIENSGGSERVPKKHKP
jgi:transcriptional regulator with XRE-family HTH domain